MQCQISKIKMKILIFIYIMALPWSDDLLSFQPTFSLVYFIYSYFVRTLFIGYQSSMALGSRSRGSDENRMRIPRPPDKKPNADPKFSDQNPDPTKTFISDPIRIRNYTFNSHLPKNIGLIFGFIFYKIKINNLQNLQTVNNYT